MADTSYTYAVARIRSKEMALFSKQTLESLLAAESMDACLRLLHDRGWGDGTGQDAEAILSGERAKTWELIAELVEDTSVFDVFLYVSDYHNLKAAIKLAYTKESPDRMYLRGGTVEPDVIRKAVDEREYTLLPPGMRAAAEEAYTTLFQTGNGQLCDVIVDQAALVAIGEAGKASDNALIARYAELTIVAANLKMAVRCAKTGKSRDFLVRSLAPCETLRLEGLIEAALLGEDAITDYLGTTEYADAVEALRESPSAFERWCDNVIMDMIKPEKYHPFTIGPLAAYILARESEIKSVRIILSGKLNDLPVDSIRERLREMYV